MSVTVKIDTREFNSAMEELRRATGIEDSKIIQNTTKGLLMNLVRFTFLFRRIRNKKFKWMQAGIDRRSKGRARLGWWPAWKALSMRGTPRIGNGPLKDRGEGGISDNSRRVNNPYITVFNKVPYIDSSDEKKRTLQAAVDRQLIFIRKAIDRTYTKMLRGKSG